MNKRILVTLLTALCSFSFLACGGESTVDPNEAVQKSVEFDLNETGMCDIL